MGDHSGAVRVYGPARPAALAPLARAVWEPRVFGTMIIATPLGALVGMVVPVAAFVVFPVLAAFWVGVLVLQMTRARATIVDRYRWNRVETAYDLIHRYLPRISVLNRREIGAELEAARWDLACLLRDQGHLGNLLRETERVAKNLAANDPVRDELAQRQSTMTAQSAAMAKEIERRLGRLRDLAGQCRAFADEEAQARRRRDATRRARRTLSRADAGIAEATSWGNRLDPAADFTERAATVVAAYQELIGDSNASAGT